ncbi:hypothetical protein, conserved [Entamoeba histolytica]
MRKKKVDLSRSERRRIYHNKIQSVNGKKLDKNPEEMIEMSEKPSDEETLLFWEKIYDRHRKMDEKNEKIKEMIKETGTRNWKSVKITREEVEAAMTRLPS